MFITSYSPAASNTSYVPATTVPINSFSKRHIMASQSPVTKANAPVPVQANANTNVQANVQGFTMMHPPSTFRSMRPTMRPVEISIASRDTTRLVVPVQANAHVSMPVPISMPANAFATPVHASANANANAPVPANAFPIVRQGFTIMNRASSTIAPSVPSVATPPYVAPTRRFAPESPEPEAAKNIWGGPTWYLFHTLAHKVDEVQFGVVRAEMLMIIYNIACNLPCPYCADHFAVTAKTGPMPAGEKNT